MSGQNTRNLPVLAASEARIRKMRSADFVMDKKINRREREKLRHRREILNAAEAVFAEKGFHRSTMEDVAARSEFSVGTLYNCFPGKEDLYRTLIEQRCSQLRDEVNQALDQATDPAASIRTYIESKIDLCLKYVNFITLYTRERLGDRFSDNKLWWETVEPIYGDVMDRLTRIFQAGIEQGCFRADMDPNEMTIALEGLTDGFMHEWLRFPDKFSFKDKLEPMICLFFKGICKE
jgi:AcrR family transcriptional regulator